MTAVAIENRPEHFLEMRQRLNDLLVETIALLQEAGYGPAHFAPLPARLAAVQGDRRELFELLEVIGHYTAAKGLGDYGFREQRHQHAKRRLVEDIGSLTRRMKLYLLLDRHRDTGLSIAVTRGNLRNVLEEVIWRIPPIEDLLLRFRSHSKDEIYLRPGVVIGVDEGGAARTFAQPDSRDEERDITQRVRLVDGARVQLLWTEERNVLRVLVSIDPGRVDAREGREGPIPLSELFARYYRKPGQGPGDL